MDRKKNANDLKTLKWIWLKTHCQLPRMLVLLAARCAASLLGVAFAFASKNVIDAATGGNFPALVRCAAMLLGIIFAQIVIRLIGQNTETRMIAKLDMELKGKLFSSILCKEYSAATAYHSGDLLSRISGDISLVSGGLLSLVPSVAALIVGLICALCALVRLDRSFAFIFLFGGIILLIVIGAFRGLMKKLHKRVQETGAKVFSFFQESLGSLLMIKVFGIENTVSQKGHELQKDNYKAQMTRKNISIVAGTGMGFIFSLGSLYALVWSAFRLYSGLITFGTLTAILQLVNQIQSPFVGLSGVVPQYYAILASAERVMEIEELPDEEVAHDPKAEMLICKAPDSIRFENITFAYDRDIVLEDASLTVEKGDFAVISGISGIGKSTLIKLLLGVFTPQSGRIYLKYSKGEVDVGKLSRPLFSYVPQGNLLLSGTIRDAVALVRPNATDEDIMRAAEISCAADFINQLPEGLDTHVGESGLGFSEGQIQRLAVTRAILADAPIILLDEATSALDEETEERLLSNIRAMNDKTCIIISHKRAAMNICNKRIYIRNKKIEME